MRNTKNSHAVVHKLQLNAKELRVGMYVCELDRPWLDTPFWFQGFVLRTEEDVKAVQKHCDYVYIDSLKTTFNPKVVSSSVTPYTRGWLESKSAAPPKTASFHEEISTALEIHQAGSDLIRSFMDDIKLGRGVSVMAAKQIVSKAVDSILHTPDALLWMTQLKHRDHYTAEHCLNVGIYAIALGRHIGLSIEELNQVGLCGMMHDLGKIKVPLDILNKPDKLEHDELKVMQSHTTMGMQLLMSSRDMYGGVIDVAYGHHERLDGKGYPRRLTETGITPYTRMIAIVDMYDAITSDRVYQNGRPHLDAIKLLTDSSGTHLDSDLTIRFIQCIGIYPCGSVVEMSNGYIGIVVEPNLKEKLKPKVVALLDENKQPVPEQLIDLATDLDASGQRISIKRTIRPDEYQLDINKYYVKIAQKI